MYIVQDKKTQVENIQIFVCINMQNFYNPNIFNERIWI